MGADTKVCAREGCANATSGLQCPTCRKLGLDDNSFFCGQDCFKKAWAVHRQAHTQTAAVTSSLANLKLPDSYDPFPTFKYTGDVRAVYPLSAKRAVPASVPVPDYAGDGQPRSEQRLFRTTKIHINTAEEIAGLREACRRGRLVLDAGAAAVRPGITTDEIDAIVHAAAVELECYPSPLNYYNFPKSLCTSVNEVICHGIPDKRPLADGDIVNLDVSVYYRGFHADLNETYYVGETRDADSVRLVETTREALDAAIATVKPGMLFRDIGNVIEPYAAKHGCSVIRTYCGHGINTLFHTAPNVPHYAKNKTPGVAKAGMTFTIEPMLALGSWKDKTWPDNWTAVTADGRRSAQFEHMLLVTDDGVEVLTARLPASPGGPEPRV
ncbi:peptidase M24, structural domain-containing protein [Dipodascopsis tothii]|uniref:peptidase M24, structural domain-containing protein n=1 Tax=Dipodascopsis tothii TaxID=44089 RepID=UPI0034CE32E7